MGIFEIADEQYFAESGEEALCTEYNLLVDRHIIPIVENEYLYEVPEYCYNIRRITYRGRQLNPYSGSAQMWSGSTPLRYSQGEPREYIYNFIGRKTIRLYPTPAESLSVIGNEDPWSGSVIREKCVMEFFRTPDFSGEEFRIPAWIRDQLVENYAILRMSQQDSQAFDNKTIKHYEWKWNKDRENTSALKDMLHRCIPKGMMFVGGGTFRELRPARPTLPWNFGRRAE